MKLRTVVVLALAASAPSSFAQSAFPAPPVAEITKKVIAVSKKYADAISCGDTEISPEMIAALIPWTSDDDGFDAAYKPSGQL